MPKLFQSKPIRAFRARFTSLFSFFLFGFGLLFTSGLLSEVFLSSALAQFDVNGTYTFDIYIGQSLSNSQTWVMNDNNGVITGSGSGGSFTWAITGNTSGSSFQATNNYNQLSYSAFFSGTMTNGGDDISGNWSDTSEQSGTFVARRNSPPPTPTPPPATKRGSATGVSCNRGPAPLDDFVCTVSVGSKDNLSPNPSGQVVFSTSEGSFRYGDTCILSPTSGSSSVSFCAVTYIQPTQGIPVGAQVPVTASYAGDSIYDPSSGVPSGFVVTKLPPRPSICLLDTPAACAGLNANLLDTVSTTTGFGSVILSYFGSNGIENAVQSSLLQRGFPISRPRSSSLISAQVFYNLNLRDNPGLRGLLSTPRVGSSFRGGQVSLGFASGTVRFGQNRDTKVTMTRPGLNVLGASGRLGASSVNVRVTVRGFRKGDRRPTDVYRLVNFKLN